MAGCVVLALADLGLLIVLVGLGLGLGFSFLVGVEFGRYGFGWLVVIQRFLPGFECAVGFGG